MWNKVGRSRAISGAFRWAACEAAASHLLATREPGAEGLQVGVSVLWPNRKTGHGDRSEHGRGIREIDERSRPRSTPGG